MFLDTSYAIALAAASDQYHEQAIALASDLREAGTRLITTQAVLLEIGNALGKQRHRSAAVDLLSSLNVDSTVKIIPMEWELYAKAFELFRQHEDKDWGLTDCVSFVVMRDLKLIEALTADRHFEQAGFRALLRETAS